MKRNAETQHLMHKVRVTIVVVHVGAVKIYVATVEALFFLDLTRFWTKLRVLVPCFPDFAENSNTMIVYCIGSSAFNDSQREKKVLHWLLF
jgi:hypothetical protein